MKKIDERDKEDKYYSNPIRHLTLSLLYLFTLKCFDTRICWFATNNNQVIFYLSNQPLYIGTVYIFPSCVNKIRLMEFRSFAIFYDQLIKIKIHTILVKLNQCSIYWTSMGLYYYIVQHQSIESRICRFDGSALWGAGYTEHTFQRFWFCAFFCFLCFCI